MPKKKVFIIGSGIAGFCAGCYLQMNGYETEIFESSGIPGSSNPVWKRDGFTFDGSIYPFNGPNPLIKFDPYWNEVIALKNLEFYYHQELCRFEDAQGNVIRLFTNPNRLQKELTAIAPEDTKFITRFTNGIKILSVLRYTVSKRRRSGNIFKNHLIRWLIMINLFRWRKPMKTWMGKCKNPLLKWFFSQDFFTHFPTYFFLITLGYLHTRNAGYPIGGLLPFTRAIEKKYLDLKGKIHHNTGVTKINTQNNQTVGITLENGETRNDADYLISAADEYYTLFKLLEGKYLDQKTKKLYTKPASPASTLLVFLGISRTFENEPPQIELTINQPLVLDGQSQLNTIPVTIYNFDPTLAGPGNTCIRVILRTNDAPYWNNLRKNNKLKYEEEKARISKEVIDILEGHFGNIKEHIKAADIATPATLHRYYNNWHGNIPNWELAPKTVRRYIQIQLPGLNNFYFIGQRMAPGSCLLSARDAARSICKRDQKKFQVN
ncbi:MAG: NAD(P)/FAD-dependent oxidoreductase [Firmicutes bacterium]|nr:NAD(P)/FAD-dependent oxidoreductase [Bacillota bacterium]